jgi:hypothetical protein
MGLVPLRRRARSRGRLRLESPDLDTGNASLIARRLHNPTRVWLFSRTVDRLAPIRVAWGHENVQPLPLRRASFLACTHANERRCRSARQYERGVACGSRPRFTTNAARLVDGWR